MAPNIEYQVSKGVVSYLLSCGGLVCHLLMCGGSSSSPSEPKAEMFRCIMSPPEMLRCRISAPEAWRSCLSPQPGHYGECQ